MVSLQFITEAILKEIALNDTVSIIIVNHYVVPNVMVRWDGSKNKYAFQQDAYRPLVVHISQHALCRGVSAPRRVSARGEGVCSRGLLPGGVCSGGSVLGGGCIPACTEADTPMNRVTDRQV